MSTHTDEKTTGPTGNVSAHVAVRTYSGGRATIYGNYVALGLAQTGGRWHIQGTDRYESNLTLCGQLLTGSKSRLDLHVSFIECPRCMDLGADAAFYPHIETPDGLSPAQERLFRSARDFGRFTDHGILVSGHEHRTARALERKGLGAVRYQGPTMGWYTVVPTPADSSNLIGASLRDVFATS